VVQNKLPAHFDAQDLHVKQFQSNRGTADSAETSYLIYGGFAIESLPEWFTLSATQQFDFTVKFPDASVFPSQSDVEASDQGINHDFGLEAVLQYATLN
jgi:hypothetical protein